MFEWLSRYDKILVTGPQRSGTRIFAKMCASDLGYTFYGEEKIGAHGVDKLQGLCASEHHFVIQCPAVCHYIEVFSAEDTAIVLMRRNIADIVASEERIRWGKYRAGELAKYGLKHGIISEVKYNYWASYQCSVIQHAFEVEYESLATHPLWIPRERRIHFGSRQTEE